MVTAIILASGKSTRWKSGANDKTTMRVGNKLLAPILGKPVLYYTVQALHDHPQIHQIYITTNSTSQKKIHEMVKRYHFPKVKKILLGGTSRQNSFEKAFQALEKQKFDDIILVHNGANPLVSAEEISAVIKAVQSGGAAGVGHIVKDTIKEIEVTSQKGKKSGNIFLGKTLSRENLVAMQTPQAATCGIFEKALAKAKKDHKIFTDETSLMEYAGQKVQFIPSSENNFKITTWQDYEKLKTIMGDMPEDFLVGFGQDSHEYENTKGMWLGGVFLPSEPKFNADSDGDVILHALCNAISQALGQMSLGAFATPLLKEKNITNSKVFLNTVRKKMKKQQFHINNLGLMLEGKFPKIDPLVPVLKKSLSSLLEIPIERIGITATTGKTLSAFGLGKGMQCFAIISLKKNS